MAHYLTPEDIHIIQIYVSAGDYPDAYKYIYSLIRNDPASSDPTAGSGANSTSVATKFWFEHAPLINSNSDDQTSIDWWTDKATQLFMTALGLCGVQMAQDGVTKMATKCLKLLLKLDPADNYQIFFNL